MITKEPWSPLCHSLWRELAHYPEVHGGHWVLCCSAGQDSVLLFHLLRLLAPGLKIHLEVLHFHHGGPSVFRKDAASFVQELCALHQVPCHVIQSEQDLQSEAEMRAFRRRSAMAYRAQFGEGSAKVFLVTAHHSQDLLETRIMRLIRGTGGQGLKAMAVFSSPWLRPLLNVSKQEIEDEFQKNHYRHVEDPSNQEPKYVRNWIRHHWLPQLESRLPGSTARLSKSLQVLVGSSKLKLPEIVWEVTQSSLKVAQREFLLLTQEEKTRMIAHMLKALKVQDYSQSHILEILKQLSKGPKKRVIRVAGCDWSCDQTWLYARKAKKS